MFIYFIEQMLTLNHNDVSKRNAQTKELIHQYWDTWHEVGYKYCKAYPTKTMVRDNDYFEY